MHHGPVWIVGVGVAGCSCRACNTGSLGVQHVDILCGCVVDSVGCCISHSQHQLGKHCTCQCWGHPVDAVADRGCAASCCGVCLGPPAGLVATDQGVAAEQACWQQYRPSNSQHSATSYFAGVCMLAAAVLGSSQGVCNQQWHRSRRCTWQRALQQQPGWQGTQQCWEYCRAQCTAGWCSSSS